MTQGIDDLNGISWELVLALLGAWVLIYLPVIKGIKSAGKVYFFVFASVDKDIKIL